VHTLFAPFDVKFCYGCSEKSNGDFEDLELTDFSRPPELPDVMKSQESNGQEQAS
jgi:hypothetical protein